MKAVWLLYISIIESALWKSIREVGFLTLMALLPLIVNIIFASFHSGGLISALETKLIPGEMMSYCLSFLAPSIYLLTKIHDSNYRLPWVHVFSATTISIYSISFFIYMVAKNNLDSVINMKEQFQSAYFYLAVSFVIVAIILRIYSVYHSKIASNFPQKRNQDQDDFNKNFKQSIK